MYTLFFFTCRKLLYSFLSPPLIPQNRESWKLIGSGIEICIDLYPVFTPVFFSPPRGKIKVAVQDPIPASNRNFFIFLLFFSSAEL